MYPLKDSAGLYVNQHAGMLGRLMDSLLLCINQHVRMLMAASLTSHEVQHLKAALKLPAATCAQNQRTQAQHVVSMTAKTLVVLKEV